MFAVENSGGCVYDYLILIDGSSTRDVMIGRFCEESKPEGIDRSTYTNTLLVWFRADDVYSVTGFEMVYWTITDGKASLCNISLFIHLLNMRYCAVQVLRPGMNTG